jgi:hypothetical protein
MSVLNNSFFKNKLKKARIKCRNLNIVTLDLILYILWEQVRMEPELLITILEI